MIKDKIAISEFKATCLKLLDQINKTGNSVLVTKHGEPIALVSPAPKPPKPKTWLGKFKAHGKITGDIISPATDENDWEVLK